MLNPTDAVTYSNRGRLRFHSCDRDGALADINKALDLNPDLSDAYINRSIVRFGSGDKRGAIQDLDYAMAAQRKHQQALKTA